ncbi:MAG: LytR/AlgR family response regulator transcription factor [Kofleriaceae bacterium]
MIRTLIVDDEPIARESLRLVLASDPDVQIIGQCSGIDAAATIAAQRPELMLLDVQMPVVDGFDVVAAIGVDAVPAIIFVTAYDHYAVRAFEVHALDYVLKPFDDRRLLAAVARAKQRLATVEPLASQLVELLDDRERSRTHLQRFIVRGRDKTVLVNADDVDCIEAADDYVELHVGDVTHMLRERLSDLETRLDPARFVRIHRSAIVNVDRVREIQPLIRGDALVVLAGGTSFRCSRSRRSEFERRLTDSPHARHHSPKPR